MYSHNAPTLRIKTVTVSGDLLNRLLALLSFNLNLAYDHRIFPSERQRLDVAGCYLILAFMGCRPAEVVDGEKNIPSDGCRNELFGFQATLPLKAPPGDAPPDGYSKDITRLPEFETQSRGRLCYEDIQLMVIRHLPERRDDVQGPTNNEPTRPGPTQRVDKSERSTCIARRDNVSYARKESKKVQDEPRQQSTESSRAPIYRGKTAIVMREK
jgi:hypothetical protein